jgi:hypothetical protein
MLREWKVNKYLATVYNYRNESVYNSDSVNFFWEKLKEKNRHKLNENIFNVRKYVSWHRRRKVEHLDRMQVTNYINGEAK